MVLRPRLLVDVAAEKWFHAGCSFPTLRRMNMANQTVRVVVTVAVVAALWLAMPVESQACEFLERLFGCNCGAAKTTYVPAYVAPASYAPASAPSCAPCAAQTCQYVPQTCYRTVYQPVPVTTC